MPNCDQESSNDTPSCKKRTLDQICREIMPLGFPYDVCVSLWHRSHGRIEEADEYFATYLEEEEAKRVALAVEREREMEEIRDASESMPPAEEADA